MERRLWTREETLVALNLFFQTPFGRLHGRNPEIIETAAQLGRTPDALAMKCCNLAALDPALKARGIRGLSAGSKLDKQVWDEFHENPDSVAFESEIAWAEVSKREPRVDDRLRWEPVEGKDRAAVTRIRVNQHLFRAIILTGYHHACAVCDLPITQLLVASHIVGWVADAANRMNPRNGLCLCAIHDRAFDRGLLHIDDTYTISIAESVIRIKDRLAVDQYFLRFEGREIQMPERWLPDPVFLRRHIELLGQTG